MSKTNWLMAEPVPEPTDAASVAEEKRWNRPSSMTDDVGGDTAYYRFNDASSEYLARSVLASRARRQYEPEIALLEAVLQDAVLVMHARNNSKNKELKKATKAWFLSDDDSSVFSFVHICEALGIAHTAVRRGVLSDSLVRKMYRNSDSYWKREKRDQYRKRGLVSGPIAESNDNRSGRSDITGEAA